MTDTTDATCLKDMPYGGQRYSSGDPIAVENKFVPALKALGMIEVKAKRGRPPKIAKETEDYVDVEMVTETVKKSPKKYKTKDMKAE